MKAGGEDHIGDCVGSIAKVLQREEDGIKDRTVSKLSSGYTVSREQKI